MEAVIYAVTTSERRGEREPRNRGVTASVADLFLPRDGVASYHDFSHYPAALCLMTFYEQLSDLIVCHV